MNTKTIEANWTELKSQIKAKWSKFSDADVDSVKADLSLLTGKVQTAYGIAKDQAERQYDEFRKAVHALTEEVQAKVADVTAAIPKPTLVITPLATPVAAAKESQAV